jgi:hypothetical protein
MLVEHFVDPEFLITAASKIRNYKEFIREFGRQSPRVIGKIQKFRKFQSNVIQLQGAEACELAQGRLIEILNVIKEKSLVDRNSQYDGEKSYLVNFINAHQQIPANIFCIGQQYDPLSKGVRHIFNKNFDDGIDSLNNQIVVQKSSDKMAEAARDFLRLSKHITFVDPYLSDRPNMLNPMLKFIEVSAINSPTSEKHINIIFKGGSNKAPTPLHLLNKITAVINCQELGISSIKVSSLLERETGDREKFHNRYMITELGAMIWGIGLDETTSEVSDDVVLMNDELYDKRYGQYCELKAFNVEDSEKMTFEHL